MYIIDKIVPSATMENKKFKTTFKNIGTIWCIYVVSWTKGLRCRLNRKQFRECRGIVGYINMSSVLSSGQFHGRACVTLVTGISGHVSDRTGKDKEMLKTGLVETPARTNAKGVQCELRSESVRVQSRRLELQGCRVARVVERSSCCVIELRE